MSEKMNDPECVAKRVKIMPPNYSKENFLATFTPQTQLTPEQVFWSLDLEKRKAEELKANTPPLRKLAAAMVYPPNTPGHLVPRTLPTKCISVISIFVLNQLFADFDKMCTKRITPTGITEGERGFEQTKRCYLTEVIPFFKLLKEHFEGVQKTLVTEVKEMKEIFKSLEAEVDQNAIDLRSGKIERKNLLITNENLIAKCIAQDVFYTVTDSALTASQFHELSIAYNVAKTRAVEFEAENLNLHKKIQNDDHDNMVKYLLRLEVDNLNLQLKYQNLKDRTETSKSRTSKDAPEFDAFFELNEKDAQLQTHRNTIHKLKAQIYHLKANKSDVTGTLLPQPLELSMEPTRRTYTLENMPFKLGRTYRPLAFGLRLFKTYDRGSLEAQEFHEKVQVRFRNDHFGAIMGYGDYVIGESVKHSCYVRDTDGVELIKGSHGSNLYTITIEDMMKSSPICLVSKASKNKSWLWHRRLNHLNFGTINDLARKDLVRGLPRFKFEKDHLCFACQLGKSKKHTHKPKTENTNLEVFNTLHMDLCGPMRVQKINGKKFILVIVDDYSRFTWVKLLRSKDETPEVVIKFLKQIQVGLNKTIRYIYTDNDTEFVNKDLTAYYEHVGIFHQKTVPRTPQQDDVVERRNCTLVEASRTMLIFSKALMFLWEKLWLLLVTPKIDPSFTLSITKPHMS
ncbi:retrovirus-related pol polyprotein from transposon TNT 1-94 [Tanacetum coccineum]